MGELPGISVSAGHSCRTPVLVATAEPRNGLSFPQPLKSRSPSIRSNHAQTLFAVDEYIRIEAI